MTNQCPLTFFAWTHFSNFFKQVLNGSDPGKFKVGSLNQLMSKERRDTFRGIPSNKRSPKKRSSKKSVVVDAVLNDQEAVGGGDKDVVMAGDGDEDNKDVVVAGDGTHDWDDKDIAMSEEDGGDDKDNSDKDVVSRDDEDNDEDDEDNDEDKEDDEDDDNEDDDK